MESREKLKRIICEAIDRADNLEFEQKLLVTRDTPEWIYYYELTTYEKPE